MNSIVVTTMIVTTAFVGSRVNFGRKQRSGRCAEPAADDGTGLAANLRTNVGAERAACTASHRGARAVAVRTATSRDVAMCLFPAAFPVLAWVFAAACALTTATRWLDGWRAFSD